ncbi:MAG: hypothetical protein IT443_12675 [Phycisphaeraceae bacterium]|nr:hypothetical protein [Phycisphaeraceae bacterium]
MPEHQYFDLQVNGYAGVDFNQDNLAEDDFHKSCQAIKLDNVGAFLPTLITEHADRMLSRLARLASLCRSDPLAKELVAGVHLEGPFLNPDEGFRGAHPKDAIIPADPDLMARFLDAGQGLVRLVTLAPENDPGLAVTRLLARRGVVVSAGHCNPDLELLDRAIDAGLSMFTHLGNGCPKLLPRHDNIIQRALSRSAALRLCFIADGAHVPFVALGNYLRAADLNRCIVVSDAVAPAGLGPGRYTIGRWELDVGADMVVRAPGDAHLVGSACPLKLAYRHLRDHLRLTEAQCQRLLWDNPRQALNLPV